MNSCGRRKALLERLINQSSKVFLLLGRKNGRVLLFNILCDIILSHLGMLFRLYYIDDKN